MLSTKQPVWEATFVHRFFPTHSNLVCELKPISKRVASATTCNFRIVKSSSGQAGISIGKRPRGTRNIPTASVRRIISCGPKFASVQGLYLQKVGNASFPATPRSPKSDIGSYVYHAHENRSTKQGCAEIFITLPPTLPRLHTESS